MRHRAFTLVELLVVTTIIVLLVAISLPVLTAVRQRARSLACRANIRQLGVSLQSYDSENQSLPYGFALCKGQPPGGLIGDMAFDAPGKWWFHYAGVIRGRSREGPKLLQCPAKRLEDPRLEADPLCGNYGVNRFLCKSLWVATSCYKPFVGIPLSVTDVHSPGSTLLIVDSGYSLTCWWQASTEPPVPLGDSAIEDTAYIPGLALNKDRLLRPGQSYDAIGGRHPNKTVNVGFADGHVGTRKADELLIQEGSGGEYTNLPLWQGTRSTARNREEPLSVAQ